MYDTGKAIDERSYNHCSILPAISCVARTFPTLFFSIWKRLLSSPTITLGKDVLLPSTDVIFVSGVLGAEESLLRPHGLDTPLVGVAVDSISFSRMSVDADDVERLKN